MLPKCGFCYINQVMSPEDWAYIHVMGTAYKIYVCDNCADKIIQFEKETS